MKISQAIFLSCFHLFSFTLSTRLTTVKNIGLNTVRLMMYTVILQVSAAPFQTQTKLKPLS